MRALSHRIALALLWLVGAVTMSGCAKEGPLFCTDCRCVIGIWEPQAPTQEPPSGIALPLVATPDGVFQFGSVQGGPIPIPAWRWDGEDWQNVTANDPSPVNKMASAAAYHAEAGHIVLVGGEGVASFRNTETWTFAAGEWTQEIDAPDARVLARAAYHAAEDDVIVFGNQGGPSTTLLWDGAIWDEPVIPEPLGRAVPGLAYDSARQSTVLFGGADLDGTGADLGATWIYQSGGWTKMTPTPSPGGRSNHTLTYDPSHEVIILTGGQVSDATFFNDVWAWDGAAWTEVFIPTPGPGASQFRRAAYDEVNEAVLVVNPGTWLLRFSEADATTGQCCGDGTCQSTEDAQSCPDDCTP